MTIWACSVVVNHSALRTARRNVPLKLVMDKVDRPDMVRVGGPQPDDRTVLVTEPFAPLLAL